MQTRLGIRWQLFSVVTPVAVVPILIIVIFTTIVMFRHLDDRSKEFYASVMQMLAGNIDYTYEQYGRTFTNAVRIPSVDRGLNAPPYKSQTEEREISNMITGKHMIVNGERVTAEGLRKTFEEKIEGDLLVYELDRKSIADGTDYKVHRLSQSTTLLNLEEFYETPMYQTLKNDNSVRLIAGSLSGEILRSADGLPRTTMIYPYYREAPESSEDTFTKFLLVELQPSFIKNFYADIEHIQSGTLYILDRFDNLVSRNHPDYNDDYYEYDEQKGQYILGDNPANDPDEPMTFRDYKMLNTDINILQSPEVKEVTDKLNSKDFYIADYDEIYNKKIILYKGIRYLMTVDYCPKSEFKLVYFHPLAQVRKPVYFVIQITIFITLLLILLLTGITLFYSKRFTRPIAQLAHSAVAIARGEYGNKVDITKFSGEFFNLGASFNEMSRQIREYNVHMEDMVARRTAELERANNQMRKDLVMAQKIQEAIVPKKFPTFGQMQIFGYYKPMDNLGGDFYDVYKVDDENIAFVIIDVCGHGVAAALITTMAKVSFFNNTKPGMTTADIADCVNKEICSVIGENNTYFTAFLGIYNTKTHKMQYTNAGHTDTLILHSDKQITALGCNSMFVGMIKEVNYQTDEVTLSVGDRIILYTDGIPETRNPDKEMFGMERFQTNLESYCGMGPEIMIHNIVGDVSDYRGHGDVYDDITILAVDIVQ